MRVVLCHYGMYVVDFCFDWKFSVSCCVVVKNCLEHESWRSLEHGSWRRNWPNNQAKRQSNTTTNNSNKVKHQHPTIKRAGALFLRLFLTTGTWDWRRELSFVVLSSYSPSLSEWYNITQQQTTIKETATHINNYIRNNKSGGDYYSLTVPQSPSWSSFLICLMLCFGGSVACWPSYSYVIAHKQHVKKMSISKIIK